MEEGALLGSGFVERSRFRSSFEDSGYVKRPVRIGRTPVPPDIIPPSIVKQAEANKTDIRQKVAKLVTSKLAVALPVASEKASSLPRTQAKQRHFLKSVRRKATSLVKSRTKTQLALSGLSIIVIGLGLYLSLISWQNDQAVKTQAAKLTAAANKAATTGSGTSSTNNSPVISTVKPSAKAVAAYAVAPNYPKYLKIPSIGVDSIVGQTGLTSSGALGTPSNVFYTDWYTGSALPGQPGATLIDGHVSSWTSHGVFYNLHLLKAGDAIQIVRGDNSVVNYQVVSTQTYNSNNVNMQAAITPVVPGVSGLNLITCTGQVIKGTSEFNERIIVFAKQV